MPALKPFQYAQVGDTRILGDGAFMMSLETGCHHEPYLRFLVRSESASESSYIDLPVNEARAFLVESLRRLDEGFGSWERQ